MYSVWISMFLPAFWRMGCISCVLLFLQITGMMKWNKPLPPSCIHGSWSYSYFIHPALFAFERASFVTLESLFVYCFNRDCKELTFSGRNENPVLRCECWLHWIWEWVRNDVGYIVSGWSGLDLLSYITMHLFISFGWKTHELYVWTLLCITGDMSDFRARGE